MLFYVNAYLRSKADNGDLLLDNVTETSIYQCFEKYLSPYIVTTKICYDSAGCWNSGDTKFLKGGNCYYNQTGMGVGIHIITAVLSDGTFINIDADGVMFQITLKFRLAE